MQTDVLSSQCSLPSALSSQRQSSPPYHAPEDTRPAGSDTWFYRDTQGNEQGPFDSVSMRSWYEQGYFAADQLIRGDGASSQPLHLLWGRPEEAFVAMPSGAACIGRGPSKRQRRHDPPSPEAAPVIDLRTASLDELYKDRLAARVAPDGDDAGGGGDGGGGDGGGGGDDDDTRAVAPPPETFRHVERRGAGSEPINVLEGLVLHRAVLTEAEQRHVVRFAQAALILTPIPTLTLPLTRTPDRDPNPSPVVRVCAAAQGARRSGRAGGPYLRRAAPVANPHPHPQP